MNHTARLLGTAAFALAALNAAPAALAADPELTVFEYAGFEDPAFHSKYVEKHGDSPSFAIFGDEEEALQKLLSGFRADVSGICAGSVDKWLESGVIEPWDTERLTYWDDIDNDLTGQKVGGDLDDVYFVPTYFGTTAIAYNTDLVPEEAVQSLDVFLDPEYAGRTTIPDNVDDAWSLAYLATGVTDWQNLTEEQFEAAADWLRQAHQNVRTYWVDPGELAQLLATEEVLLAWAWNETLPTMRDEGFPIGFQREAKEGSAVWLCGLVNLKDGPGSEDNVYDYVNAFLDPSSTEALVDEGYGQTNATAMAALGEERLAETGMGTVHVPLFAQLTISVEWRQRHADTFGKIKAGF